MHEEMIRVIEAHMHDTRLETGRDALSPRVLAALRSVRREWFVPAELQHRAHDDTPLSIGSGQTISQPFIVALMTELLDTRAGDRILEIGFGSGYQTAILAELVGEVYGIEIVPELARRAQRLLHGLGYRNVHLKAGDGHHGWPEHAPYDGILVAAAGGEVPDALRQQLRIGGKLVLPLEDDEGWQRLQVIERIDTERFSSRHTIGVRFVPLTRGNA
jgi:protein-L-isoaspartate(D-aspartate) O-methyltransferase